MNVVKVKRISSEAGTGAIINDYAGANTIGFFAKLPKSAIIDRINVDGKFLDDLGVPAVINYGVDNVSGEHRVSTVYFPAETPTDLIEKIGCCAVYEFDVYYHIEAIAEVE